MGRLAFRSWRDLGADVIAVEASTARFSAQWIGNDAYVGDRIAVCLRLRHVNKRSLALICARNRAASSRAKAYREIRHCCGKLPPRVMERLGPRL